MIKLSLKKNSVYFFIFAVLYSLDTIFQCRWSDVGGRLTYILFFGLFVFFHLIVQTKINYYLDLHSPCRVLARILLVLVRSINK